MEVLMTTSTPPAQLVVLSSISAFAGNLVSLALYLAAGVALFRAPIHVNVPSCLVVLILSLVLAMAPTLGALAGFRLGLLPLTLWGLSLSLRRARLNGTLSFY